MRYGELKRVTYETDISVDLDMDGTGKSNIDTGIGFMDHMLTLFSRHGIIDLNVKAEGDLNVDYHHTVEDIGIVIGKCLAEALNDKKGLKRYGTTFLPMDETLVMVSIDISGRPFLAYDCKIEADKVGEFDTELVEEFFRAVAFNGGLTIHVKLMYGKNAHHIIEAMFKAFGRALREAASTDPRVEGLMTTKGVI
ncbi:MAG: imidazoleglycerol-phosphate dehydratase HisB [Solirubrobacterales bacterium]